MQTFFPYPDYRSVRYLDNRRLGKQRVEALQILRTVVGDSSGWQYHPAVRMWQDCAPQLAFYGIVVCDEWRTRGFRDTVLTKLLDVADAHGLLRQLRGAGPSEPLPWFVDEDLCLAHRANLVRKDPAYYAPLFGNLDPRPYIWPRK